MYPSVYIYVGVCMPWHVCGDRRTMFGGVEIGGRCWGLFPSFCRVAQGSGSGCRCWQPSSPVRPPHWRLAGPFRESSTLFPTRATPFSLPKRSPGISVSPHSCQHLKVFSFLFPYCRDKTHHRSSVREEGLFRHSLSGSQGGRAWSCCL